MPIADLHREIIRLALAAVGRKGLKGVALGGGNALIARADSPRATRDVDFCCNNPDTVGPAALEIAEAIKAAGYRVVPRDDDEDRWWEEAEGELVEFVVSAPGDKPAQVEVQIAYFGYEKDSELDGLGPVLALDDLAGLKVTCLGNRHEERDLVDYVLLRQMYTQERLFELGAGRDPGLTAEDYADTADWLDSLDDADLAEYLAPGQDAAQVRAAFADWPRSTRQDL